MLPTPNLEHKWMEWYPKIYGYFYKRVSSQYDCEELTAQTMNTVFMAQNVRNFKAYAWKVAHNYLVKYIQTKSTAPMLVSLDDDTNHTESIEATFSLDKNAETYISPHFAAKLKALKKCIANQLQDPQDKELIELSIYQEKNSTQISQLIGIRPDAIRKRLSRLLHKLRSHCLELWPETHSFHDKKQSNTSSTQDTLNV